MPSYEKNDAFGRYNPGVEFAFFIGVIVFSALFTHPAFIAVSLLAAVSYYLCLKGRAGLRRLLFFLPLFLFITAINPLFNVNGKTVLFHVFGRPYTLEAVWYGMANSGIFISLAVWYLCYGEVMTSDKFTGIFGNLIPSLSMLLVMVLRLIPSFQKKTGQIAGARRCLGLTPEDQGSLGDKLRSGTVILSAVTSWALENSVVTSDSMRSRGYGAGKRSNFNIYRFDGRDAALAAVLAAGFLLTAWAGLKGLASATYTPDFHVGGITGLTLTGLAAYAAFAFTPTILNLTESLQWHILRSRI